MNPFIHPLEPRAYLSAFAPAQPGLSAEPAAALIVPQPLADRRAPTVTSVALLNLDRLPASTLYADRLFLRIADADAGGSGVAAYRIREAGRPWGPWLKPRSLIALDLSGPDRRLNLEVQARDRASNRSAIAKASILYRRYRLPALKWLRANLSPSGLVASNRGSDLADWTFSYDQAIAAQSAIAAGELQLARQIVTGAITNIPRRLGGFINAAQQSAFNGKEWLVTTGPNAHLGLAFLRYARASGDSRWQARARAQADFLLGYRNSNPSAFAFGGIPFGPAGEITNPADQHFGWDPNAPAFTDVYSTEHQIDAFLLFSNLSGSAYQQAATRLLAFIRKLYNPSTGLFAQGYNASTNQVDHGIATDVQAWAVSALGPKQIESITGNPITTFMDTLDQAANVSGVGYDFVARSTNRLISPERSLQVALAKRAAAESLPAGPPRTQLLADAKSIIAGMNNLERKTGPFRYAYFPDNSPAENQDTGLNFNTQTGDSGISYYYLLTTQLNRDPMRF